MYNLNVDDLEPVGIDTLEEHVFELYTLRNPAESHGLGFIQRANNLSLSVGAYDLNIEQSLSLLNSRKESSTTGAMVWKVCPYFAEWLVTPDSLFHRSILNPESMIVELGAGSGGVLATVLADKVKKYIVTDQSHIIRLADKNIKANADQKCLNRITACEFDWEYLDTIENFREEITEIDSNGVVIATDTIYNEYLIPYFVGAIKAVAMTMGPNCHIIIAQQLRDSQIFEDCLREFLSHGFQIWSVQCDRLSKDLSEGFAVHYLRYNANAKK